MGKPVKGPRGAVAVACGAFHVPALKAKHTAKEDMTTTTQAEVALAALTRAFNETKRAILRWGNHHDQ